MDEWEKLAIGHRFGPPNAAVVIIEWGDYECPVCKHFHEQIETVLAKYPDDAALIYRHWPLTGHRYAYPAARAAECAGDQGAFHTFHAMLFEQDDWLGNALHQFAARSGVANLEMFNHCLARTEPVPRIEADIRAARAVGGRGTPTLIVNGVLLGFVPDSTEMFAMVDSLLAATIEGG